MPIINQHHWRKGRGGKPRGKPTIHPLPTTRASISLPAPLQYLKSFDVPVYVANPGEDGKDMMEYMSSIALFHGTNSKNLSSIMSTRTILPGDNNHCTKGRGVYLGEDPFMTAFYYGYCRDGYFVTLVTSKEVIGSTEQFDHNLVGKARILREGSDVKVRVHGILAIHMSHVPQELSHLVSHGMKRDDYASPPAAPAAPITPPHELSLIENE